MTYQLAPNGNFPKPRRGYNVQFFVKAYRSGDPALGGIAGYRLVQVRWLSGWVESRNDSAAAAGFRDPATWVSSLAESRSWRGAQFF